MEFKTNVSVHNRFDIIVRDAKTEEVIQTAQAENIVLDRIYTRLCTFNTYFVNIIFGSGTGTPIPSRNTLFARIGYKAAETAELVRAYPTSSWTRKIRLGVDEYNGNIIREIGISDDATQINTHALITDAEGNPLEVEKNNTRVMDIYATVFATVYNIDHGLYYETNGIRDYLTGSTVASDSITIGFVSDDDLSTKNSTRSSNTADRTVTTSYKFGIDDFNREVRYIQWNSVGIRCLLPRPGVFEGYPKTNVIFGTGDGTKIKFHIPHSVIKDLIMYVDGVVNSNFTLDNANNVVFNTPIVNGSVVSGDYTCLYFPKDKFHTLTITMKLQFGGSQPDPVLPPLEPIDAPGNQEVIAGNSTYGFFGDVPVAELISGADLCNLIGLTAGTLQNSDTPWLKFVKDGRILYVAKKTFRHSISWSDINAVGAVFGNKIITLDGIKYAVRLMSSSEWDKLMYPIHISHPSGAPNWWNYTDQDLLTYYSYGNGSYSWTSTSNGLARVLRGYGGVYESHSNDMSSSYPYFGFRPVLEIL